jgi:hypothetical protein
MSLAGRKAELHRQAMAGTALTWTDRYNDGTAERTRTLGTGERIDVCNFPNSGRTDTRAISVTATDRGGLTGMATITVFIIPGGLDDARAGPADAALQWAAHRVASGGSKRSRNDRIPLCRR